MTSPRPALSAGCRALESFAGTLEVDGESVAIDGWVGNEEYRLNGLARSFGAKGSWRYFDWQFDSTLRDVRIHGRIHAQPQDFVGLTYYNPPGGSHTCLNSKIAACELTLERKGREPLLLRTAHRAAFEILTDDTAHGIPVVT